MRKITKTRRSTDFYLLFKWSQLGHVNLPWEFNTNYSRYLPYDSGIYFCLPAVLFYISFTLWLTSVKQFSLQLILNLLYTTILLSLIYVCLFFSLLGRLFYLDNKDIFPLTETKLYYSNPLDFYNFKTLENERRYYE